MTRVNKYLGFDDRWLTLMGIPSITIIISLMIFGGELFYNATVSCLLASLIFTTAYWFTVRFFIIQYHKRYPDYTFNWQRLLYVLFFMTCIYFGVKVIIGVLVHLIIPGVTELVEQNQISEQVSIGIMMAAMFFLYEGIYYFNKSRMIEIEKNKLEFITAEQKLNTLKNQVNPHFLFNSLNTLMTIIPEEPNLAINFVQNLSKVYRNILEVRDEKLISIQQELSALDSYIYLLKTRFQGKIHIYNTIEPSIKEQFILPLSLQILMENAVKHNITSKSKPLRVDLYNEDGYVVIKNNLQKKNQDYNSTKVGLANIKSRYHLLVEKDIVISETQDVFMVKLPIIKKI